VFFVLLLVPVFFCWGTFKSEGVFVWCKVLFVLSFFVLFGFVFMVVENLVFFNLMFFVGGFFYLFVIVFFFILIGYVIGSLFMERYFVFLCYSFVVVLVLYGVGSLLYLVVFWYGLPYLIGMSWAVRFGFLLLMIVLLGALFGVLVLWTM